MGIFKAYFSIMSSKFDIGHDTLVNIGTFNVHELLWMLQRNRTNNDESTFFNLNIDCFFVWNWVLRYINENAKRSAESILMLYIHFRLSLIHLEQAKQIVKVQ